MPVPRAERTELEGIEIVKVNYEEGLSTFLSDNFDVVICEAEFKGYHPGEFNLLNDIKRSVSGEQKIFRAGFLEGGDIPLLRCPFTPEEFKKCIFS